MSLGVPIANEINQLQFKRMGSIFANYQLNGVQLAFTDARNQGVLLANPSIESAFQSRSSCMTCHFTASVNPNGEHFDFADHGGDTSFYVGNPPSIFGWTSLDHVWSTRRASRQKDCPPEG